MLENTEGSGSLPTRCPDTVRRARLEGLLPTMRQLRLTITGLLLFPVGIRLVQHLLNGAPDYCENRRYLLRCARCLAHPPLVWHTPCTLEPLSIPQGDASGSRQGDTPLDSQMA